MVTIKDELDLHGWQRTTWGQLVELKYGKGLKGYRESKGIFPVYGTNGPVGWSDKSLCSYPSVIVGRKGAYRGIHFSDKPFYVIDTAFYVQPKTDFNLKWAYYNLLLADINSMDSGSAIPSTSREDFYALSVNVPPRSIQDWIVDQLNALNSKIELNRQINQTLEQMAQALFKSWFVDFDPVIDNALAAGNPIPDELQERAQRRQQQLAKPDHKPLPDDILQLFPSEFKLAKELGWVPKGWGTGTLGDIASYEKGKIDTAELNLDNYISTENMNKGKSGVSPASKLSSTVQVPRFSIGQVLISNIRPYFKKIWFASCSGGRSNDVLAFQAKNREANEYLFNLLYQDAFFQYMTVTSKGTKMPRGDKVAIMDWPVVKPTPALMEEFSTKTKPSYLANQLRSAQSISLIELRDTLLPKLISGELQLPSKALSATEQPQADATA